MNLHQHFFYWFGAVTFGIYFLIFLGWIQEKLWEWRCRRDWDRKNK